METLNGILERIVFENPDNGYTIGRFSARGHSELITIVGNLASVYAGESLILKGEWVNNPKYGRQFQIDKYETILPANIAGIKKYLGSGLIKGIGPKMASRIVNKFGMDTIDVIEQEPDKIAGVEGIGRKRVRMIQDAWEEQREIKNVMLFLQSHNVSTAHAAKIFKTYQNEAIQIVTENPYRLADDIYGIGFVTADTIAQKLGMSKDDPHRVQAGIKYVLSQKADDGHVFQHGKELSEACQDMLELDDQAIEKGIYALRINEEIILSDESGQAELLIENSNFNSITENSTLGLLSESQPDYIEIVENDVMDENPEINEIPIIPEEGAIYLAPFFYAEMGITNQFQRLLSNGRIDTKQLDIDSKLDNLQHEMGIEFASQQREAIHTAVTERTMILTGGPGTGKTTTTVGMIRMFESLGNSIVLAAPTGRAAKRLSETTGREAKTIHRLLEFSPQDNGFKRNRENPLEADVVILDEMSMVDIVLMNRLMQAVPTDASLILIGDTDQLPSVGAGNVLNSLIQSMKIPIVKLTEIFRQAQQSMIVTNAHLINTGEFPKLSGPKDRNFFFIESDDDEESVELITTLISKRLPKHYNYHPIDDIQLLCPMRKGSLGSENLNQQLQEVLNPNAEQAVRGWHTFRVGDKVMQIRNNYDYDVYNGDIGRIAGIDQVEKTVKVRFPEKIVAYDMADLNELVLAYATTIHKAQGSEYPAVVIPIHTQHYLMLQRNLLYTGITRAKERVIIVGTKQALGICIRNNQVMERNSYLAERLNNQLIEG
ncbi:ATP-dependent RecD-like DNA helicase [Candidatus Poribacteria bacterium]|nr:MAG: ATP-dependent RecD-like DNA helicase [Candidatus Poribacteria bacterium]